jgi:LuxR family maltose regulon positive regulatory protein
MLALVTRTEGWVAGLMLATLALTRQDDRRQFMTSFTGAHPYLREYFMESVLYRQPLAVQAFLLKTAILKHLTGSLCDAVTGQMDGAEMLSRLWQESLFLVRMEEPGWYRYHDLFAEMLCSQLRLQFPAEIPHLHRRAAEWYRTQNALADAVYHLLAIEAWEEAASLIESMALRELEQSGEDSRLLRWLRQMPETVVQQHKTLLFVYVRLAAVALPHTEVERFLAHTEINITRRPTAEQTPDEQDVLTEIQRIRHLWATGDSVMSQLPTVGEHNEAWQMLNGILQLRRYSGQNMDEAEAIAREVYETARARRNLFVMLMAGGGCVNRALMQGYLRRSEKMAHQVLQQAFALRGKLPEPASITLAALSQVCYERNQLAQAHQLLLRATEVDPNPTSSNTPILVAILRAKIQSAQGKGEAAQATLQAARELNTQRPSGLWLDEDLIAYQALICMRQGDYAGAERLLSEAGDTDTYALSALVQAEILLEQKQGSAAEDLLNRLITQYPHGLFKEPILGARVLLACALFEQHKVNQARQVMVEAIRRAAPESFLRPFLDHGLQSRPLLMLVLHTENLTTQAQAFVKEILRMVGHANGAQEPLAKAELRALSTAASISPREQQVLRLVSAGLSNREIAIKFSVSDSTVKTHLENIYRKLGVNSRTQAVVQAQALKLV